jgi:hypothetical protein
MIKINGIDISHLAEDFNVEDVSVESFERGARSALEGMHWATKKQIEFTTAPLTPDEARALEGWILGEMHLWTFSGKQVNSEELAGSLYSKDSGLELYYSFSGSEALTPIYHTYDTYAVKGFRALTWAETSVLRGATTGINVSHDWSVCVYRADADVSPLNRQLFSVVSRNGVVTRYIDGAVSFHSVLDRLPQPAIFEIVLRRVASPAATTPLFSHLMLMPFALTPEMLTQLAAADTSELPRPPFVQVTGELMPKAEGMVAKAFISGHDVIPATIDGVFYPDSRQLTITLTER